MEKPFSTPSLRGLLAVVRARINDDQLSDEAGRRLIEKLEQIVHELTRIEARLN